MSSLIRTVASAEPKVSAAMTAPTTAIARISLPLPHSMSLYGNLTSRIFFGENFPVGTCGYLTRVDIFPRRAREGIRKNLTPQLGACRMNAAVVIAQTVRAIAHEEERAVEIDHAGARGDQQRRR